MQRRAKHPKHIASLESIWYLDLEDTLNVKPILEIISARYKTRYVHLPSNTKSEFEHNLNCLKNLAKKPEYKILYLAFHGKPNSLILADHSLIDLKALSHLMRKKFADWIIHFGTCGTIDTDEQHLSDFIEETGVQMVSGYAHRSVDWVESAALDLIYFQYLQHHIDMKELWHEMMQQHNELILKTGLKVYFANNTTKAS